MSEYINFVYDAANGDFFWEHSSIISSLVYCFSPQEACDALDVGVPINWTLREALLRKISRDIESDGFAKCHQLLTHRLIGEYDQLPANRRQGCCYCLEQLYVNAPEHIKDDLITFFLTCSHVGTRRRAYKLLRHN